MRILLLEPADGPAGVTEEHSEKSFGSMQRGWSDRRAFRKGNWVNAEGLE
ncbi:hypothetical protein [Bacillus sp. OK048]|nr:hypothetical protein [Bacillus sp. OK048]